MNGAVKKLLLGVGALVATVGVGGGAYAWTQISAFDESVARKYDVPLPAITLSTDPAVLARGKHLAESIGACATSDCHGTDLGGGKPLEMGPLGVFTGPNITAGGLGSIYTDADLVRLVEHGVTRGGTTVRFMPAHEVNWLPADDLAAVVSYVRSVPSVARPNGPVQLGALAKILDRRDAIIIDVARRIDHSRIEKAGPPAPTKEYGRFIARLCTGCHGEHLSGGPIPGAPPDMPPPRNLTPHETGLAAWSLDDFKRALVQGKRPDGTALDGKWMPFEAFSHMDETELAALWDALRATPPRPLGER
ncbi:MAG: cytochrome C [Deltaproteobacteria bacterium]|nr:cytochrome C [Deltaproteobacteria bacterium]